MWFGATIILGLNKSIGIVLGISLAITLGAAGVTAAWLYLPPSPVVNRVKAVVSP